MSIRFLYFDLGNVLLTFSNERACQQMGQLARVPAEAVQRLVLEGSPGTSFLWRFERGDVTEEEFYEHFCATLGVRPPRREFEQAASDMFAPIPQSLELVERLHAASHRMGVLSNTNPWHWRLVTDGRYHHLTTMFEQIVTSYDARAMKPEPLIYQVAIERAGTRADEIFFVDDRPENVEGARKAGIDAVVYRDYATLLGNLRERGIDV